MREFRIVTIDLFGEREELVFVCDAEYDGPDCLGPSDWLQDYINPELYTSVELIGTWW